MYSAKKRILDGPVMDREIKSSIRADTDRILGEIRLVGALGEIFQLFEGTDGPVKLEPDCLGVIGREIVERTAGVMEAVQEIRASLDVKCKDRKCKDRK